MISASGVRSYTQTSTTQRAGILEGFVWTVFAGSLISDTSLFDTRGQLATEAIIGC